MSRRVGGGGTGAFGARLVERLVATTDLAVVIAARRHGPANELADRLQTRHPGRDIGTGWLDVAITLPVGGRLVHDHGWLMPHWPDMACGSHHAPSNINSF